MVFQQIQTRQETFTLEDIARDSNIVISDSGVLVAGNILEGLYDVRDLRALRIKEIERVLSDLGIVRSIIGKYDILILPEVLEEKERLLGILNEKIRSFRGHHRRADRKCKEKIREVSEECSLLERMAFGIYDMIKHLKHHTYKPVSRELYGKFVEIFCSFSHALKIKEKEDYHNLERFRKVPQHLRRPKQDLQTDEKLCAAVLTASLENSNSSIALITRNTRHMPSLFCTAYACLLSEQFAQENGFLFQTFNPRTRLYIPVQPDSNFYLIKVSYNDIRPRSLYIKDCSREDYEEFINLIKTKLKEASRAFDGARKKHL